MAPRPDPKARETRQLWLLAVGLRHRYDMLMTGMRGRLVYHATRAGLLVGVVGLAIGISWDAGYVVGVVGFAISLMTFVPEWIRMRRPSIALVRAPLPHFGNVQVGDGTLVRWRRDGGKGTECAVAWDEVDEALPESTAQYHFSHVKRRLPGLVNQFSRAVLATRGQSQSLFNGKIVRQDDDLTPAMLSSGGTVRFSKSDYFSMVCSNYLTGWRIIDRRTGAEEVDGAALFIRNNRMLSLAENHQANGVGISTLAFCADGAMILTLQASRAASSPGLLAPAGSGSMDLRDLARPGSGDRSLVGFVARAMQREFIEEANLRYRDIEWTEVLGYFRWLNMGGKPEYVGVTRVNRSSQDLMGRDVRLVETPFVQRLVFDCEVDLRALRDRPENMSALDHRFRRDISMPLFMCLRALGRAMRRDGDLAARLTG